ncbi:ABC transporter ATP-binding protein [Alkalihalobacillus sp. CinArs1]|uniref:ABC transporter ATP-binding protein n=1 Tax=Alkalihalobacillus sp. CinArs1 TaxID=2995314 RepID=UPI0022DCE8E9|nr:ABC transporter ATP-binding protein [Alkalihalobacillus sp. CinArs1]
MPRGHLKSKKRPDDIKGTMKRIWSYLSVKKGLLSLVLLLVLMSSVFGLLGPYLTSVAIDDYLVKGDLNGLLPLLFVLIGIYFLQSIVTYLQNFWMIGIAQKTVLYMRKDLFHHFQRLPIPYFDKKTHGELMSRLTNDIENVSKTLNSSVIQIFSSVLTLIGTVAIMIWLSPLLTLITFTIIPLMFLGMKWITKRTGYYFKEQQRNLGTLNGVIEETISGQQIVKTFSQEERVKKQFAKESEELRKSGFWALTYSGFIPKLMNVLNNLSFVLIAAAGGWLALEGLVTIGVIVAFIQYSRQFTRPLNDLANQFNTILSAVAGAERVFVVLDEKEEQRDRNDATVLTDVVGHVSFRGVSFGYEKDQDTLKGITFSAQPGESVAIVGPTGAGKTTIVNLLMRFYEIDEGTIEIDGKEITSITRDSLRGNMGFVLQDTLLFEESILENIRYGRLEATDEEVRNAARIANAHSFISKLPNGYHTVLKQDGGGISHGQRQLLSIARAVLADPAILILDEATSSIDTRTEIQIQRALWKLMEGRTSFVIAHRLNTIQRADQILVLHQGEILEKGSHEELLKKDGFYKEMVISGIQENA